MSEIDRLTKKYGKSTANAKQLYREFKETGDQKTRKKADREFARADAYKTAIENQPDISKTNNFTLNANKTVNKSYFSNNSNSANFGRTRKH